MGPHKITEFLYKHCWTVIYLHTLYLSTIFFRFTVCTPFGFVRLFGVVGQVLVKPHLLRDVNEEYIAFHMEEASVKRKLANLELQNVSINESLNGTFSSNNITYDTPTGSYILHNMLNGHHHAQHQQSKNNFSYYYNNLSSRTSLSHLIQRKPMNGDINDRSLRRKREINTYDAKYKIIKRRRKICNETKKMK